MIFGTVGTHDAPFNRLVAALDAFAAAHPEHEVVIQTGHSTCHPRAAAWYRFAPSLEADMARAALVVTHCGSGTVIELLMRGTPFILVPRTAARGEHINDHQVLHARALRERYGVPAVEDTAALDEAILEALGTPWTCKRVSVEDSGICRALKAYLDSL